MNLSELARHAFATTAAGRPNRAMAALFDEILRIARSKARSFDVLNHDAPDEVASRMLLKLHEDKNGRIAEILEDADPEKRERRLRRYVRRAIRHGLIDLQRRAQRDMQRLVSFDSTTGGLQRGTADEDAPASAAPEATWHPPSQEDGFVAEEQRARVDALLADLDALIARTRDGLQPRYRERFAADARDLLEIALERTTMAGIVAARGGDPADRTQYNTVNRGLSRVRERLLDELDAEDAAGEIAQDLAERLRGAISLFLLLRGAGTK